MPFIHPAIFWSGLAGASLPVIIHLLNRRRFRPLEWAAMRFLRESLRRNRRRLRLEELILLAIRCLVVLLLGIALGRFTGCSAMGFLPTGEGGETVVFVLDDSCSMGQKVGGTTVFAAATTDLAERIKTGSQGRKVAVVLTSRLGQADAFFGPDFVTDVDSLVARLQSLRPTDGATRLPEAIEAANSIFKDAPGGKRLYVLSDFRRVDLPTAGGPRRADPDARDRVEAMRKQFAELRKGGVKVVVMDYGRAAKTNLTIESIDLAGKFAVAKVPVRIAVTVRNNSPSAAENVELRLGARVPTGGEDEAGQTAFGEVSLPVRTIGSLDAGESRRLEWPFTPQRAGPVAIIAELGNDELPGDNVAQLALDVREAIEVLVVDGRVEAAGGPARSESYFFTRAIDPKGDGGYGKRAEVIASDALAGAVFDDYDLVVLAAVQSFPLQGGDVTYPQLEALQQYVRDGGGLAIFTGRYIDLTFYQGPFYGAGAGLCPLHLRSSRQLDKKAMQEGKFWRLDPKSIAPDQMLRVFRGEAAAMTGLIRFTGFTLAEELAAPPAVGVKPPRVLARFDDEDNSPAIVARQFGKGNVMLFTTTASTRWTDWPIDEMGTYVAVMNDMVAYLAKARAAAFTARVGRPIALELRPELLGTSVVLKTPRYPAAELVSLVPSLIDQRNFVRYEHPADAGVYWLNFNMPGGAGETVVFARNVDPLEGRLRPAGRADLVGAFGSDEFTYVNRTGAGTSAAETDQPEKEYWIWAIAALLVLLTLETFLAQRFGHYR